MQKICPFCGAEIDAGQAEAGEHPGTIVCPTCFQELDGPEDSQPLTGQPEPGAPPGQPGDTPQGFAPSPPQPPAAPPPPGPGYEQARQAACDEPPPYTGNPKDVPAWELDGGFMTRIWVTIWQVLLHPVRTLSAPPRQDGYGTPLAFGIILGTLGGVLLAIWQKVFPVQGMEATTGIWKVILLPLTNLVGIFVTAAVIHVFLWLFRGTRRGFKATFRAVTYCEAANIFFFIPSLGVLVGGIWGFVAVIGALSGAHATGKARVFFALIAPLVAFALLMAVLVLFFGLGAMMGAMGVMKQQAGTWSF